MATTTPSNNLYPSMEGEFSAESQAHVLAVSATLNLLRYHLRDQAVVFANQFFYYIEGKPRARVTPDLMVVKGIPISLYNTYKLWENAQTPCLVMEVTSERTKDYDMGFKKPLYAQIGIKEYWLFDPLAEWLDGQLRGYQLTDDGDYTEITDNSSQVLGLRLEPKEYLLNFYRLDDGSKLPNFSDFNCLLEQYQQTINALQKLAETEKLRADAEKLRADRMAAKLQELGVDISKLNSGLTH
jgi:Uma2 family endonuclease